ncbi:MAG: sigma 54-interacting transcriptional regulator [Deltaproteobacteria bacterium]|nr:sigma 54-interacting transcriptional regulator [Deltaproteobacteria bacterium]
MSGGTFVVIKGPDRGETVALRDVPIYFGSAPTCDLVLTDKTVSRKHLMAVREGNEVILRDQGSTNGSSIQGSRFKEITMGYGAEIKVGRTVLKYMPEEEVVEPEASDSDEFGFMVGRSVKMRRLFKLLEDVAQNDATVLIEGETGTGKELVAEEIHNHSPRKDGPFVVFDCGAVPRELVESALFGHVRGSFTGAITDRKGAFAEAHGGTIFLDEIGELPLELQPSLLRALDKKSVRRVGANIYEKVDVRIIAATNRDLRAEIANKSFREDLYYRLAVIRVTLPPLRERGDDIKLLVEHFVKQFSSKRPLTVTPEDMSRLVRHSWPGNVRELRNVIERACVLSKGESLNLDDAFTEQAAPALGIRTDLPFKEAKGQLVELFEREYIVDLMRRHKMNLSAAAREAQIDRKHLRELIRKYGLDPRGDSKGEGDDE